MYMDDETKVKYNELETQAYKKFMASAKRICKMYPSKYKIIPNMDDPLRKFKVECKGSMLTYTLELRMNEGRRRGWGTPNKDRIFVKPDVYIHGMYPNYSVGLGVRLSSRMVKRMLAALVSKEEQFYITVQNEIRDRDVDAKAKALFNSQIAKVNGLKAVPNGYHNNVVLEKCPFRIYAQTDEVELSGSVRYEDLAKIAEVMKWGNYA